MLSVIWYILVKNRPSESKFVSEAELNYIEHGEDQTTSEEQVQSPKKEYKLVWLDKLIRATKANPLETKKEIFRSWDIWGPLWVTFSW